MLVEQLSLVGVECFIEIKEIPGPERVTQVFPSGKRWLEEIKIEQDHKLLGLTSI